MNYRITFPFLAAAVILIQGTCNSPQNKATVMFYNVENLFDTINDPNTHDDEFTPEGKKEWNRERYHKKLSDLSKVVASANESLPDILGLCEVENRSVVEDLIAQNGLSKEQFGIIHKDSPDKRGIDVAAIYNKKSFELEKSSFYKIKLEDTNRPQTRDVLYFKGKLKDATVHVFVCHWPSRSGGEEASEPKRLQVATLVRSKVDSIMDSDPIANILLMGDLNDYPINKSVQETLGAKGEVDGELLVDLFLEEHQTGTGTYNYKGEWGVLDHFIVSKNMLSEGCAICTDQISAQFFKPDWLLYHDKNNGAKPNRTYSGSNYTGGYSDHLPILLRLEIK